MKTYVLTYTITITAEGTDEEQAENNGWNQLENLLAISPSIRDFSCHSYGAITQQLNKGENNE